MLSLIGRHATRAEALIEWQEVLLKAERWEEAEELVAAIFSELRATQRGGRPVVDEHLKRLRANAVLLGYEEETAEVLAEIE